MENNYILHHSDCERCVFGEEGFYNPICCHCKYVEFGKSKNPKFMTREMAEFVGVVKPKN